MEPINITSLCPGRTWRAIGGRATLDYPDRQTFVLTISSEVGLVTITGCLDCVESILADRNWQTIALLLGIPRLETLAQIIRDSQPKE